MTNERIYFGQNPESPFRDERLRIAYFKVIDRDAYITAAHNTDGFEKAGLPVQTFWEASFHQSSWSGYILDPKSKAKEYGDKAKNFQFDIAEAKKLIEAAGYKTPFEYRPGHLQADADQLRAADLQAHRNLHGHGREQRRLQAASPAAAPQLELGHGVGAEDPQLRRQVQRHLLGPGHRAAPTRRSPPSSSTTPRAATSRAATPRSTSSRARSSGEFDTRSARPWSRSCRSTTPASSTTRRSASRAASAWSGRPCATSTSTAAAPAGSRSAAGTGPRALHRPEPGAAQEGVAFRSERT